MIPEADMEKLVFYVQVRSLVIILNFEASHL